MWSEIVAVLETDQADQHRQALAFLKAAYDRLEVQIRSAPDRPWVVSLRSEQAAVMQRIREEIAGLFTPDAVAAYSGGGYTFEGREAIRENAPMELDPMSAAERILRIASRRITARMRASSSRRPNGFLI